VPPPKTWLALAGQARRNLEAAGYATRVEVVVGDGTLGLPERAPFDAIAVAAAAVETPAALEDQLAPARFVPLVAGVFPPAGAGA
jgi:protein-L-isoaspartate O-methyltransferase